jgi:hypothetical protein
MSLRGNKMMEWRDLDSVFGIIFTAGAAAWGWVMSMIGDLRREHREDIAELRARKDDDHSAIFDAISKDRTEILARINEIADKSEHRHSEILKLIMDKVK